MSGGSFYTMDMHVHLGTDHGGYTLKEHVKQHLLRRGYAVTDHGTDSEESVDYPVYAALVGEAVAQDTGSLGILFCRSGEGMAMAANKMPNIRAALCWSVAVAQETRQDNDANVLVLPADFLTEPTVLEVVQTFLETPFSGLARHSRRIAELSELDNDN